MRDASGKSGVPSYSTMVAPSMSPPAMSQGPIIQPMSVDHSSTSPARDRVRAVAREHRNEDRAERAHGQDCDDTLVGHRQEDRDAVTPRDADRPETGCERAHVT